MINLVDKIGIREYVYTVTGVGPLVLNSPWKSRPAPYSYTNGGCKMIGIVAKLSIQEGKVDEAIDLVKELMEGVATEAGTLYYTMNRDKADPNAIVILERYRDKADLDFHSNTPHFKTFFKKIGGLLAAKPDISILEEINSIR